MRPDSALGTISPVPIIPPNAAVIDRLVDDLAAYFDDGGGGIQRLVARIPMLLEVDRAYVALVSRDGLRFTVTNMSLGSWPDLLGYTQSMARLPAFARAALGRGVQATIIDGSEFPFTPQQRKMLWYDGLGATIFTPIRSAGTVTGALVLDMLGGKRTWERPLLDTARILADAIGARIALARLGDHLASDESEPTEELQRSNILANLAHLLEHSDDAAATSDHIVEQLALLDWVAAARMAPPDAPSPVVREALATGRVTVQSDETTTTVGVPLLFDGEHFSGIELELVNEQLTTVEEQFLRTVQVFAGSAYASAVRRGRPRDEALRDALTGLLSYRSVHEQLVDEVHAAKSSGRPVAVWLIDIEGLDAINRAHGYAIGDDVVGYVGHAIGSSVQQPSIAGRSGGGVYLVVLPTMDGEEAETNARMLVEKVTRNAPGHLPTVGLTVGVSAFPAQAIGHDDLVRTARLALYAAKNAGPNRVVLARARDDHWVRDAHAAFVRIVSEQQLPSSVRR